ncbi:hypothetical protein ZIOFF_057684 [Zingiber officinale]|uniref:Uncharacterized protein n=1 Tax=Zingiber officinale TaxID=94328 RepID=A0A8J5F2Z6_ZINOF|nr:hypothetical protein ZIOFF_057684 [Zingiber officinale]
MHCAISTARSTCRRGVSASFSRRRCGIEAWGRDERELDDHGYKGLWRGVWKFGFEGNVRGKEENCFPSDLKERKKKLSDRARGPQDCLTGTPLPTKTPELAASCPNSRDPIRRRRKLHRDPPPPRSACELNSTTIPTSPLTQKTKTSPRPNSTLDRDFRVHADTQLRRNAPKGIGTRPQVSTSDAQPCPRPTAAHALSPLELISTVDSSKFEFSFNSFLFKSAASSTLKALRVVKKRVAPVLIIASLSYRIATVKVMHIQVTQWITMHKMEGIGIAPM